MRIHAICVATLRLDGFVSLDAGLSQLDGQAIRLRFQLRNAKLFAFWSEP